MRKSYGLKASVSSLTLSELSELIDRNVPVIANILKYAYGEFYVHSVVVYRIEKTTVYFLDPEDGEKAIDVEFFERLWKNNDYTANVIERL